ncbi:MAG: tRNA pseudouridine(55) synthase TruB, partial [Clostridia bacterium]
DGDFLLDVKCSKGTYVRSLCHDIGESLGCGGCMSALRRVRAGAFSVQDAHTLPELIAAAAEGRAEALLLPLDGLFAAHPALTVDADTERRIRCGSEAALPGTPDGSYRIYGESGAFLSLSRAEAGVLTTIKSFFEV